MSARANSVILCQGRRTCKSIEYACSSFSIRDSGDGVSSSGPPECKEVVSRVRLQTLGHTSCLLFLGTQMPKPTLFDLTKQSANPQAKGLSPLSRHEGAVSLCCDVLCRVQTFEQRVCLMFLGTVSLCCHVVEQSADPQKKCLSLFSCHQGAVSPCCDILKQSADPQDKGQSLFSWHEGAVSLCCHVSEQSEDLRTHE